MPSIPGYQKHHILPQAVLDKSDLAKKYGYDKHSLENVMYLPCKCNSSANTLRSRHAGYHRSYNKAVARELEEAYSASMKKSQTCAKLKEIRGASQNKN